MTEVRSESEHDRALWREYRHLSAHAPLPEDVPELDAADATLIAAYLDRRLDEWALAAFERRLVEEPRLLEVLVAAREALQQEHAPAPQAVIAYALNCAPGTQRDAVAVASGARLRAWFGLRPVLGWSIATAAFIAFSAVGLYVGIELHGETITADGRTAGENGSVSEDLDRRSESIFNDPAKTYFDGTEVDD